MKSHPLAKHWQRAGFTLGETMITLSLVSLLCVSVFASIGLISRLTAAVAIRSEADRLLQAEAERLTSVDFNSFVASTSDQTITSCYKTSFQSGTQGQFVYPTNNTGRVNFARRVVAVAATGTTKTLRVEVQWTWQNRTSLISTVLFRSQ